MISKFSSLCSMIGFCQPEQSHYTFSVFITVYLMYTLLDWLIPGPVHNAKTAY